jgi:hypothetical protein
MEDFSITTRLTAKDYFKVMFIGLYRKPGFIVAAIFGCYLVVSVILDHFKIIKFYSDTPYFEFYSGLFILLGPSLIVIMAVRQFRSNPNLHEIRYTFSENGIAVQGLTFKAEFLWAHIIKQKGIYKFLILYHSKRTGNFIDKTKLTADQIQFIKSKVRQK